jgi:hypothetical protein
MEDMPSDKEVRFFGGERVPFVHVSGPLGACAGWRDEVHLLRLSALNSPPGAERPGARRINRFMKPRAKRPPVRSADLGRINLDDRADVRYWMHELQVEEETLRDAVEAVGPAVEKVRFHIALGLAMHAGRSSGRRATPG